MQTSRDGVGKMIDQLSFIVVGVVSAICQENLATVPNVNKVRSPTIHGSHSIYRASRSVAIASSIDFPSYQNKDNELRRVSH